MKSMKSTNRHFLTLNKCYICVLITTLFSFAISYILIINHNPVSQKRKEVQAKVGNNSIFPKPNLYSANYRSLIAKKRLERLSSRLEKTRVELNSEPALNPKYNVHIFYYAWYRNPETDGTYKHWDHKYLPNWRSEGHNLYPSGRHKPPEDIGSNFYPVLGAYSSRNVTIIDKHMKQLRDIGVGVVALSWYPPNFPDSIDDILPNIFDTATKYELKVALHIEPYPNRNAINLRMYLKSFFKNFIHHPALYRTKKNNCEETLPLIYIYDSYLISHNMWRQLLSPKSKISVRKTEVDAIYIGLLVEIQHRHHIKRSHFDGFYTYFAVNGFSYGSSWKNWKELEKFAEQNDLLFIPSVGPGYIDTRIRPWNLANTRHRRHGQYYDVAWRTAINVRAKFVSITSFNEWHEGTQIEPALPKIGGHLSYLDYEPEGQMFYLNLTKFWIRQFEKEVGVS